MIATWVTWNLLWQGAVAGLVTGLLALGLVLVYRSTRIINFAVGDLGLPMAFLLALCVLNFGWPFWPALLACLLVGTIAGAIVELTVIRRLFRAPRVIVLVATVGVAQLAVAVSFALPDINGGTTTPYPSALSGRWQPGLDVIVTGPQVVIAVVVPLLAVTLGVVMNRTRFGRHVQASATNADLARLSGINPKTVSTGVWSIAGFLSALSSILLLANQGSTAGLEQGLAATGPGSLLRALAAALLAGMRSFPRAVAAGVAIGVLEALLRFNHPARLGLTEFALFLVVIGAVAVVGRRAEGGGESFSFAPRIDTVPEHLRQLWLVRNLRRVLAGVALAAAVLLPVVVSESSRHLKYSSILAFAICAVSVTILTGWGGQLSLAQMAFAGLGALSASSLQQGPGLPFGLALLGGAAIAAATAFAVGFGALRVRGLLLSVSTLAFALAAQQYLYRRTFLSGGSSTSARLQRGSIGPFDLSVGQRSYYYFSLVVLVLVLVVAARLRASGVGRSIVGVRENEASAAAMTVSPVRTKLLTFTLAGFVAGLGGAVLGGLVVNIPLSERFFMPADSLRLVALAVIGGLGSLSGAVLGALWVIGIPYFFPGNDLVPLFTSSIGLLILLLYLPGGLVQIGRLAQTALFGWLGRRLAPVPTKTSSAPPASLHLARGEPPTDRAGNVLATTDLTVRFGGIQALTGVAVTARPGEVVGLIGTNGAGKSTLLNAIGGYVPADGTVVLLGRDVSGVSAAARARRGLGRTFQAATLFPELTVRETVQLALEGRAGTSFAGTVVAAPRARRAERAKRSEAAELIDFLGLGRYADRFVAELSTGTRRIVELASVLAVAPRVLCLDEPTAGVAQREAEAFGPLILSVREELGATLLMVEHDMPLIMSISDRVYCMESGSVIAEGTPAAVRSDPAVIASYLGTDQRAIQRSGTAPS
jgi:ABC-type branched-subunit amino acid transport system ATPase component/ABC-type branched-subunit amino acid transport system permease subunit